MSDELTRELAALGAALERRVDDVRIGEVVARPALYRSTRRSRSWLGFAAAMVLVITGLVAIGRVIGTDEAAPPTGVPLAGAALADALVGRTWVAVDFPQPQLPWLRFEHGSGRSGLAVSGWDGCNSLDGSLHLDATTVVDGRVRSTLVGCLQPLLAGLWTGARITLADGTLTIANPEVDVSTSYIALDTLAPLTPGDLVGNYVVGTDPVVITADTVELGGCLAGWSADGAAIEIGEPGCPPLGPGRFSGVGDGAMVILRAGDDAAARYTRLDRPPADAPDRPGLASLLGAIGDRTWVYDAPSSEYPPARRPSLRFSSTWREPGDRVVSGFDGCDTFGRDGRWLSTEAGWALAVTDAGGTAAGCQSDRPGVAPSDETVVSLGEPGTLVLTGPDGIARVFRDVRATTRADVAHSPLADLPGRWELEPGVDVEFIGPAESPGAGELRLGACTVPWWGAGNEWIGAGPVPPECAGEVDQALLDLLDTGALDGDPVSMVERPITVGLGSSRDVLYLASADATAVFRLSRVDPDGAVPISPAGRQIGFGSIGPAIAVPQPWPVGTIFTDLEPGVLVVDFAAPDLACLAAQATATVGRGGAILVSVFVEGDRNPGAPCPDGAPETRISVPLAEPLAGRRIYTSTVPETGGASAAAEATADAVIGLPADAASDLIAAGGFRIRDVTGAGVVQDDRDTGRINVWTAGGVVEFATVG